MKNTTFFLLLLIVTFSSCDKSQNDDDLKKSTFKVNDELYLSNSTVLYHTQFGQILDIKGDEFELLIVLSDSISMSFNVTDTLKSAAFAKARCILMLNNSYLFSSSGLIEFDPNTNTGSFTINMENNELKNGRIVVNSVINGPIIDFSNITSRDDSGFALNVTNPNDWIIRTEWELVERLIFNTKEQTSYTDEINFEAFPNPFNGLYQLRLNIPQNCLVDVFYVNENFEIEQIGTGLHYDQYNMFFADRDYKGNFYRLYYKARLNSNVYFGTGDLKVKK